MPRATKDTKLDSPAARAKLATRHVPYWRAIDRGTHLGYQKGKTGGRWIARTRSAAGKYHFNSLGAADDVRAADGAGVLDFYQAQDLARAWFKRQAIEESGDPALLATINGPYTVAKAMEDYLAYYAAHRKQSGLEHARGISNVFILPEFGKLEVAKLKAPQIRKWHDALAVSPARSRPAKAGSVRRRAAAKNADERRARKSTANRKLTVLKAALNLAYHDGYVESAEAWRRVKPFAGVEQARIRYLGADECKRLVNACASDFRALVQAALLTGARYGELTAMRVDDYHADSKTVLLRETKNGKPRNAVLSDEGVALFDQVIAGRAADDAMFVKADGGPWKRWHQRRPLAEACGGGSIDPPTTFHVLRHTHASQLAMQGVPMAVIAAQLGHSDTRMTEMHYAHLAPSYIADTIRAHMPKLGIVDSSNIKRLKTKSA